MTNKIKRHFVAKCQCCKDELEVFVGDGQVIFSIDVKSWRFRSRLRYAFAIVFLWRTKKYGGGGSLWVTPTRWRQLLKKFNALEKKLLKHKENEKL